MESNTQLFNRCSAIHKMTGSYVMKHNKSVDGETLNFIQNNIAANTEYDQVTDM